MFSQPLWLILVFVCTVSMTACDSGGPIQPPVSVEEHLAQERAVYETIIQVPADGSFVIRDKTTSIRSEILVGEDDSPEEYFANLRDSLPTLQDETWQDLLAIGVEPAPFPDDLDTGGPYHVITDEEWAGYFGRIDATAWDRFEETYDAHAFGLYSRVGLNRAGTQALVYRGVVCGPLCGSGEFLLLEKENGVWTEVGQSGVWIS